MLALNKKVLLRECKNHRSKYSFCCSILGVSCHLCILLFNFKTEKSGSVILSDNHEQGRETVLSVALPLPRQQVELGARRSREEILNDAFHNTRANYTPNLEPTYYKDNQGEVCVCACVRAYVYVCACVLAYVYVCVCAFVFCVCA